MSSKIEIHPVNTEEDYENALANIEKLWGSKIGTRNGEKLDVLTTLVEKYEEENYPLAPPDPIDAIIFRMEQRGMSRANLGDLIGSRSRATEVLNKERRLTLGMIRVLHKALQIPAESLIQDYSLKNRKSALKDRKVMRDTLEKRTPLLKAVKKPSANKSKASKAQKKRK